MQGYSGKIGRLVYDELCKEHEFIELYDSNHIFEEKNAVPPNCDAVIDFSTPSSAYRLAKQSLLSHIPFISGTTGLSKKMIQELSSLAISTSTGAFLVSNFDESIEILYDVLKKFDEKDNKIILTEYHHVSKKDCPSGTALSLVEAFNNAHVSLSSIRSNRYQYRHVVQVISDGRKITFEHQIIDKKVYVEGVKKAILKVSGFVGLRTRLS